MAALPCCCCFISGVLGAMATCFLAGDLPVLEPLEELDEDEEELPEELGATSIISCFSPGRTT